MSPARTEVVRWSPFDSAGRVKKTLSVKAIGTGNCWDTYTTVGDIAYRCIKGHLIYLPCWRDGPDPTEYVICSGDPWTPSVERLRSPHLLLDPGVTFDDARDYPWAIELTTGDRCLLGQGAHSVIRRGSRTLVVDYQCGRDKIVLLRNLRRGRVWRIGMARYVNLDVGFKLLGDRTIRRAFFGALPPAMERQHELAHEAVAAARRVIHKKTPRASLGLAWVRLTLPGARWAHVIFSSVKDRGFAVLHRSNGRWLDASSYKPYCTRLPTRVRRQLFFDRLTWKTRPYPPLMPSGEQRC